MPLPVRPAPSPTPLRTTATSAPTTAPPAQHSPTTAPHAARLSFSTTKAASAPARLVCSKMALSAKPAFHLVLLAPASQFVLVVRQTFTPTLHASLPPSAPRAPSAILLLYAAIPAPATAPLAHHFRTTAPPVILPLAITMEHV